MCGVANADDRPTGFCVVDNVFHLIIGKLAPTQKRDQQIGRIQDFQTWNIVVHTRIDLTCFGIDGEQDCA